MNKTALLITFMAIFMTGWFFNTAYALFLNPDTNLQLPFTFQNNITAKAGPQDHIAESQIHVYKKGIIIQLENATWSRYTDTHSMDPVLNKDSNGIELIPQTTDDIKIGDIVSYYSEYAEGLVVHRVVAQGYDDKGWYVQMKGDNLENNDPGKIRFNQIHGVLVAVIY